MFRSYTALLTQYLRLFSKVYSVIGDGSFSKDCSLKHHVIAFHQAKFLPQSLFPSARGERAPGINTRGCSRNIAERFLSRLWKSLFP